MGEIIQEEHGKKGGKPKPKKHSTRIDMTPMVDLMCLLITFFMLTTAFSKPKAMEITMPDKTKDEEKKDNGIKIPAYRTLNVILTGDNEVYYYWGLANDPDKPKAPPPPLVKSDFSKDGIRKVLLERNKKLFESITKYREDRISGKLVVADSTAKREITEMKKMDKSGPFVLIKADDKAKYRNIVDIVDEMAICNVASYAIVDIGGLELQMLAAAKGEAPMPTAQTPKK